MRRASTRVNVCAQFMRKYNGRKNFPWKSRLISRYLQSTWIILYSFLFLFTVSRYILYFSATFATMIFYLHIYIYIERVTKIVYMSEFDWQVLYKVCVRFKMWWKFILTFHYPVIKIIFKIILFRRWKKDKNLWIDFINIYKLSFESEISLYYKIIFVD